jgi:hypothetical protein
MLDHVLCGASVGIWHYGMRSGRSLSISAPRVHTKALRSRCVERCVERCVLKSLMNVLVPPASSTKQASSPAQTRPLRIHSTCYAHEPKPRVFTLAFETTTKRRRHKISPSPRYRQSDGPLLHMLSYDVVIRICEILASMPDSGSPKVAKVAYSHLAA